MDQKENGHLDQDITSNIGFKNDCQITKRFGNRVQTKPLSTQGGLEDVNSNTVWTNSASERFLHEHGRFEIVVSSSSTVRSHVPPSIVASNNCCFFTMNGFVASMLGSLLLRSLHSSTLSALSFGALCPNNNFGSSDFQHVVASYILPLAVHEFVGCLHHCRVSCSPFYKTFELLFSLFLSCFPFAYLWVNAAIQKAEFRLDYEESSCC